MRAGVRLAVDVGTVRIGIARSDATGALAVPLEAVRAGANSFDDVAGLVREWEAIEVIVGLPLSMSGEEGRAAAAARDWATALANRIEVPVRLVDERLSTVQAQRALHAGGRTTRQSRSLIDSASAVMVLQADLDREAAQGSAPIGDPPGEQGAGA